MEIDIVALLDDNWIVLLFLVIGFGYVLGRIKVFGVPLGATIGVLAAGLVFGHFGLAMESEVATFGFTLFIFSVGIEAGPTFFSAFREDGPKYVALAVLVVLSGFGLAWSLSGVFEFEKGFDAGLLSGALTSTPTLVGAQDAIRSGLVDVPRGETRRSLIANVDVGYALTYLIGSFSVISLVRWAPKLLGIDLEAVSKAYKAERSAAAGRGPYNATADRLPIIRAYRVEDHSVGRTVAEVAEETELRGAALKLRRGEELIEAEPDLVIEAGDVVSVIASVETHEQWARENDFQESEVFDADLLNYRIDAYDVVVVHSEFVGKSLEALDLPRQYGCWAAGIVRSGVDLQATGREVLLKGDRLQLIGEQSQLRTLADRVGYIEQQVEETDLGTFAFGIAIGALLGLIAVRVGGVSLGLGTAGGLLLVGVCIGYLGSLNPTFGRVPVAARFILKELGLMLLMAGIGLNAGGQFIEGLTAVGPSMMLSAVFVALGPVAVGYFVGRKFFKMNLALLLGALMGAMTSTPSLNVIAHVSRSNVPAIGYAGTYALANVLLTLAGIYIMTT